MLVVRAIQFLTLRIDMCRGDPPGRPYKDELFVAQAQAFGDRQVALII